MRRQLEDMFRSLSLVHDEIGVASEAARSEGQPEMANMLSLGVCNRLFSQLKSLTNVIERLGGRTELSETPEEKKFDRPPEEAGHGCQRLRINFSEPGQSSNRWLMDLIPKLAMSYPRTVSSTKSTLAILSLRACRSARLCREVRRSGPAKIASV
jgi:hypothetical protein